MTSKRSEFGSLADRTAGQGGVRASTDARWVLIDNTSRGILVGWRLGTNGWEGLVGYDGKGHILVAWLPSGRLSPVTP